MGFVASIFVLTGLVFFYLLKQRDNHKFTKATLVLLIASIIANISLAQNYTQSLVPGAADGISISNRLAYLIITDGGWGKSWSVDLFRVAYETSTVIVVVSGILLIAFMLMESKMKGKRA